MKRILMAILAVGLMTGACNREPATEGSITIDRLKKGAEIPASMYGVFFEEINHAGDGGLYAELVQNRSFEEKEMPAGYTAEGDRLRPAPVKNHLSGEVSSGSFRWSTDACPGWEIRSVGDAKATLKLTKIRPLHPETPNSAQVDIPKNAGEVMLVNKGYWGMGVTAGDNYNLRFYMRIPGYKGDVSVKLLSSAGSVIAEAPLKLSFGDKWYEYTRVLTPSQSDSKASLALCFSGAGTVWVDYVSLIPEKTFHNRPNGLRKDVAEFLAALKPAFIRWPGGCIVEGITLSNRVEWKKSLGDPMSRSGQYDTWGYRNTYGFGYHEFLQYCEDIGAKGMFVCNVGLGCEYRSADACSEGDVAFYIDDVLDAIEYAIGEPTTEWGAKRVAAGHPEPLPLQYVEIGNENWGPVYNRRFDQFYKAIKEKYPQLTLISNHGLGDEVKNITKTDMIDPHWYVAPDFFFRNATIFDKVPRGDFKVYVGEYACNSGVGSGNMLAALSEAAFLTGMERNSDLVRMTSYAPLFENSNDRTWPVNLIWMNSTQVMGRSSYYVQKMMAENRPSYNLVSELSPRPPKEYDFAANGKVGAGTWITQAEYKDVRLKTEDGETRKIEVTEMRKVNEEWTMKDGVAAQTSDKTMTGLICREGVAGSYTFEVKARKTGGNEGFLIYFGMNDTITDGYLFNIGGWMNTKTALERTRSASNQVVSEMVPQTVETGRWYDIKVVVSKAGAELWIDGVMTLKYKPVSTLQQFIVSGYDESAGEVVLKVVNADTLAWNASVKLANTGEVTPSAKVITLSAKSLDDENTFADPVKIAPRSSTFDGVAKEFRYHFEPCSFTILRIKVDRQGVN